MLLKLAALEAQLCHSSKCSIRCTTKCKVKLKNIRRPAEVYRIILGHPFDQGWVEVERIPCGPKS